MKLKVRKLDWKQKIDKLRRIVLSGPAIEDLPPRMLATLEAWRANHHGKITNDEYVQAMKAVHGVQDAEEPADPMEGEQLIWEPYSDERGEDDSLYGWRFQATMFGINGQPWWLVHAQRESAVQPTDQQWRKIHEAIGLLGCHDTKRDLIHEFPDEEDRWIVFWSWFHTGPLLEIHGRREPFSILTVVEGTPVKEGYERMERISRKRAAGRSDA